jgi:hypothetical protein
MIREWLLVVWLGTSTNFTLQGTYWSLEDCARARHELIQQLSGNFVVVCTQDMREGRSTYAARPGSSGIVK